MKLLRTLMTISLAAAVGGVGCSKQDDKKPKPKQSPAKTSADQPAPPATTGGGDTAEKRPEPTPANEAPTSKLAVDPVVMGAIKAVVTGCEIDPKNMRIKCAKGEDKALHELYGYTNPRSRVATIGTLAVALGDSDARMQTVAANLLGSKFSHSWGKDAAAGSVTTDVASALLAAMPKLGTYQRRRAITAVTHAAMLANQETALFGFLDATPDQYVKRNGYAASMFYGRLRAFPKVTALAKSSDAGDRLAAVKAAYTMPAYTTEEKGTICPWALEQAKLDADNEESPAFEYAGYVATRCRGPWIDKLLDFGEAQLAKGKFNRQYYFVYRGICFSMARALLKEPGVAKQCDRNYAFLEKATNNTKIQPEFRGLALDAISYQRRDAKSLRLMQRYKNHKVAEIKKRANDAIKMLQSYVKK